jgi:peptidoglycan-associated lipoprotein
MKKHASVVVMAVLAAVIFSAGFLAPASADAKRFRAFVYPDRTRPELSVVVDDFRINETVFDEGGVQYVWVYGPSGNFQVPFSRIRQVEFLKFLGPNVSKQDWVWYQVHVSGVSENEAYDGRLEVRVMRGIAPEGVPWYLYPATEFDRGRKVWRIVFGDQRVEPTVPWEAAKPVETPIVVATPQPPPPPPLPTEDDLFARLTVDDLNKQAPLGDVYFDYDKAVLRPDAESALQRNAAWLKRWPSVKVRIEGTADPRGTNEYNMTLGGQRAEAVRDYLVAQGVAVTRFDVVSTGETNLVCTDQTEGCWARNRRGHFLITAK